MRWVILTKAVATFSTEIEISLIACCFDLVQIFIFEECFGLSQPCRNWVVVLIANTLSWFSDMVVHFGPCKHWHICERSTPATFGEFHTSLLTTIRRHAAWRLMLLLPSCVKAIWIRVDNILISPSFYIFFNSNCKEKYREYMRMFAYNFWRFVYSFPTSLLALLLFLVLSPDHLDTLTRTVILHSLVLLVFDQQEKHLEYRFLQF